MNPLNVIASVAPFILILFLALWIFLWGGHARALRRERKERVEALKALDALRRRLEALQPAKPPEVPQTQAELDAYALKHLGQLPVELPAGHVRADTCPPGMVEVKVVMPPGHEEMHKAMSAHEGGNGNGVSLADPHKNSASHLGGD